ncbi:MAG TPA: SDR family oxidoreductase [Ilumatobacteraceae bacterium]|nr:SDR family oxidoreductase [Ilumatobacteraceae bacterium]HRB04401.1 SDR family oxidoreductase [Ilumatobacteraceae bacterium]
MSHDLSGHHAIVIGGGQGIGRRCAHALAAAGAMVTVADINPEPAAAVAAEIAAAGGVTRSAAVDIADPGQCAELIADATSFGATPDVLVNCATLYRESPALDQDPADWTAVIHVGLNGAFFISQAFARAVVAAGTTGRIVHLSSVSATHSMYGKAAYGTAKAGLDAMTRALAFEWGPLGICVNAVSPSHVLTEGIVALAASGALSIDRIAERIPLGRLAEPDEIADAVVFLASDRARFITGQILAVDGGYTANGDWAPRPS